MLPGFKTHTATANCEVLSQSRPLSALGFVVYKTEVR